MLTTSVELEADSSVPSMGEVEDKGDKEERRCRNETHGSVNCDARLNEGPNINGFGKRPWKFSKKSTVRFLPILRIDVETHRLKHTTVRILRTLAVLRNSANEEADRRTDREITIGVC